jgi:ABC-type Fe3+-hydroxamate transport system substrate-binding protein
MLDALGALDLVVGVGDYVDRPPALAALPKIGGYDRPNVERVLSLEADLLITAASREADPAHARLEELGVEVLALDTATYAGVLDAVVDVGRVVGRPERAQELARRIRDEMDAIRREAGGLERSRVLFVVGRDPIYVAGPGSHIDEMIEAAGGSNVAADADAPYARLSLEAILERMPEVIVDTSDNTAGASRGAVPGSWEQWPSLPAVRRGRVYHVHPEKLVIAGIDLPDTTRRLARLVHPERFGEPLPSDFE